MRNTKLLLWATYLLGFGLRAKDETAQQGESWQLSVESASAVTFTSRSLSKVQRGAHKCCSCSSPQTPMPPNVQCLLGVGVVVFKVSSSSMANDGLPYAWRSSRYTKIIQWITVTSNNQKKDIILSCLRMRQRVFWRQAKTSVVTQTTARCRLLEKIQEKEKKRMHAPIWFEREKLEAYQGPETPGFSHSF